MSIRGLTTAACLWVTAGIGMSAGAGRFGLAGLVTGISLGSLLFLNSFERICFRDSYRLLFVQTPTGTDISRVVDVVERKNVSILYCDCKRDHRSGTMTIRLTLRIRDKGITDAIARGIIEDLESSAISVNLVKWSHQ